MDILIPLGTESRWQNNELRYCLRSIERFATGFERIFVVGEDPCFLNGSAVYARVPEIGANREARIAFKILWAFENTDVSDEVAIFNDDYVVVAPMDLRAVEYFQQGPLYRLAGAPRVTAAALRAAGKPTLDYDVHYPIIYRRQDYIALLSWWKRSRADNCGFVVHSVYANNLLTVPGPFMEDCKIRGFHPEKFQEQIKGRLLFSYCDGALNGLGSWLEKRFTEKSAWEK